ncbi:pleckstrin homology domain-containing family O member 2 isoform X2 [Rhinatrema bivittatum]|uniref:pleckstrin homology domain-containing family O member 2 isoform X2 n=1 Tax=Rhinatrema bivittatum TaxID=194408 RepID=UPI001126DEDA|nr:pleckstrin homology domain-containing family O member 2 isoform X2 [Rhinatrema bivittatum]
MGDGLREDPKKPKSAEGADKAGWVKKSGGGLLGLWKDRYLLLCKRQLSVYESEVQDIKFQAKNIEEKEGWIKALNEAINKGKNEVFDEVTVDKNLALEHVTRDRAKVIHGRRPPTRIHLKEVASTASDGMMRLDLDMTYTAALSFTPAAHETADVSSAKEAANPPMPPIKPNSSPATETSHLSNGSTAEPLPQAPAPPPKHLKEKAWKGKLCSKEDGGEGGDTESTTPSCHSSKENLTEVGSENGEQAPGTVPKILADTLDALSPVPEGLRDPKASVTSASRENLVDSADRNARNPPIPPPKILSERLKIRANGVSSSQSNLETEEQDSSTQISAAEDEIQVQSKESPSNVLKMSPEEEPQTKEDSEKETEEELESVRKEQQERSSVTEEEEASIASKQTETRSGSITKSSGLPKPRCASLGDLLSECREQEEKEEQVLHLRKHHLASGQEKKVLAGSLVQDQKGKGSDTNADVQELRQATEVLQEIGEERSRLPAEEQKALVTLYRRSMP